MKKLLTGIQPSGELHIGNYFGAIKPLLQLGEKHEKTTLFIADLHALTSTKDKTALKKNIKDLIINYIACGVDPEKILIFQQSKVAAHCELLWILSNFTPMGLLERAHAFKDKKSKGIDATVGLFTYPILMSADILLYDADVVPVGKDQAQHLEIARDLAQKFNHAAESEVFTIPEGIISDETGIIPGIDGQKMSKSYSNTIPLFTTEAQLKKKVMSIVTDSTPVEDPKDPEKCNVFALCKFFLSSDELKDLEEKYKKGGMGYGGAKKILLEAMIKNLKPLWEKRAEVEENFKNYEEVLEKNTYLANRIATRKMEKVKKKLGLL